MLEKSTLLSPSGQLPFLVWGFFFFFFPSFFPSFFLGGGAKFSLLKAFVLVSKLRTSTQPFIVSVAL